MSIPAYSHIVVVMEENHEFGDVIGNSAAPYMNALASGGGLLTNYFAVSHPSEPNYFALYAGSTFGVTDDDAHSEPGPTLASILRDNGLSFTGYVESGSPAKHNPWESFPEGFSVEQDFSAFPQGNFASLPTVSFVIPNLNDDDDGTMGQADSWLQNNLQAYAQWALANNSLLIVQWDESELTGDNHVPSIFYGAGVVPGTTDGTAYNNYNILATIAASEGVMPPRNAAGAAPVDVFGTVAPPPSPPPPSPPPVASGTQLVENTESSYHYAVSNAFNTVAGTDYSFAATLASTDRHLTIAIQTLDGTSGIAVDYDLQNGVVDAAGGWGAPVAVLAGAAISGGNASADFIALASQGVRVAADVGKGGFATAYAGDGTSGVDVNAISLTANGANQLSDFSSWTAGHAQLIQAMASFGAATSLSTVATASDPSTQQAPLLATPHS